MGLMSINNHGSRIQSSQITFPRYGISTGASLWERRSNLCGLENLARSLTSIVVLLMFRRRSGSINSEATFVQINYPGRISSGAQTPRTLEGFWRMTGILLTLSKSSSLIQFFTPTLAPLSTNEQRCNRSNVHVLTLYLEGETDV